MKQVLTVSCKLQVTPEQVAKIDDLLRAFAEACDYTNRTVKPGLVNEQAIQSLVYNDVRARFGLSSQLAIHTARRVASNRRTAKQKGKSVRKFAPTSATYDERVFSFGNMTGQYPCACWQVGLGLSLPSAITSGDC